MSRDAVTALIVLLLGTLIGLGAFVGPRTLPRWVTSGLVLIAVLLLLIAVFLFGLTIAFGPHGSAAADIARRCFGAPATVGAYAGVAQWQSPSLPSWSCRFDPGHPLFDVRLTRTVYRPDRGVYHTESPAI